MKLSRLKKWFAIAKHQPIVHKPRPVARPLIELLEDRSVPSVSAAQLYSDTVNFNSAPTVANAVTVAQDNVTNGNYPAAIYVNDLERQYNPSSPIPGEWASVIYLQEGNKAASESELVGLLTATNSSPWPIDGLSNLANGNYQYAMKEFQTGAALLNTGVPSFSPLPSIVPSGNFAASDFSPIQLPANTTFEASPVGTPWMFSTVNAGVAMAGTAFAPGATVSASSPTPQVAYITGNGSISQMMSLPAGADSISFAAAQNIGNSAYQQMTVFVDGTPIGQITPATTSFDTYQTANFTIATAGLHVVSIVGNDPLGGGNTAFVTIAQINSASANPAVAANTSFTLSSQGTLYSTTAKSAVANSVSAFQQTIDGSAYFLANGNLFQVTATPNVAAQQIASSVQTFAVGATGCFFETTDGTIYQVPAATSSTSPSSNGSTPKTIPVKIGPITAVGVQNVHIGKGPWTATTVIQFTGGNSMSLDFNSAKGITGGGGTVKIGNTTTTIHWSGNVGLTGTFKYTNGSNTLTVTYSGPAAGGAVTFSDGTNTISAKYTPSTGATASYTWTSSGQTVGASLNVNNGTVSGTASYTDTNSGLSASLSLSLTSVFFALSIPC